MVKHVFGENNCFSGCSSKREALFTQWLAIFGILFTSEELLDEEIEQLIEERTQARKNRDFARSDEIRDQLKEKGILLDDTPQGTRWRREA